VGWEGGGPGGEKYHGLLGGTFQNLRLQKRGGHANRPGEALGGRGGNWGKTGWNRKKSSLPICWGSTTKKGGMLGRNVSMPGRKT